MSVNSRHLQQKPDKHAAVRNVFSVNKTVMLVLDTPGYYIDGQRSAFYVEPILIVIIVCEIINSLER